MNLSRFFAEDTGVTAIEYGLIAGLIAVAIIAALTALGDALSNNFNDLQTAVENAY